VSKATLPVAALASFFVVPGIFAWVAPAAPAPATPTITSHPRNPTSSTSASFTFSDSGAVKDPDNNHDTDPVMFLCSLDGAKLKSCSRPANYSGLADGSHTFQVVAEQEATVPSSPASFTWTVDTKPAVIALSFPHNNGLDNAASWNSGCPPAGYCGSADDPVGVSHVQLSIQQVATSRYWNGSSVSSSSQTFVNATLSSPGGSSTNWSYGFVASTFPADGKYRVNIRATDSLGHQTAPGNYITAAFTIVRAQPPPPTLVEMPPTHTNGTSAHFAYRDSQSGITFQCELGGSGFNPCGTGVNHADYSNLSPGRHQFQVIACDAAGNCSNPTVYSWTIVVATQNFGISGTAVGLLYPGGATIPINIVISNPFNTTLTVTSVAVTGTGSSNSGCTSNNVMAVQNFSGSVNIPANTTESFMTAGVPQSSWPMVRMIDSGMNQDVCKSRTVQFSYSGSGTHN